MARTIRFDEMDDYVKGKLNQLIQAAVLQTDTLCKQESPVDTGRFRASWQVGQDAAGQYDAGPQQSPVNTARTLSSPPGTPRPPLRRMNYMQEAVGHIYSVHNNLPYAEPLANGSSKQAAPGWVQLIAKDMQSWITTNAERIAREP